jgi:hypothetical protein
MPSKKHLLLQRLLCLSVLLGVAFNATATTYYCNPATGSMSNPGTYSSPWSTLEAVFAANKTFAPGDAILLYSGYHGLPVVKGNNTGYVSIIAVSGQVPKMKKLIFSNAQRWYVSGLYVSPEYAGSYEKGNFIQVNTTSSYITIQNCRVFSAASIAGWSGDTVLRRFGNGIVVDGPNCRVYNNLVKEVHYGIVINKLSTNTNVQYNTVEGYDEDGLRGLASYCKFEYNLVKRSYSIDEKHDDGFQSWTVDSAGTPGKGILYNVELRGNVFINAESASQPFANDAYGCHGIGCYNGIYQNWIVENNLIVADWPYTLGFVGAINCRIVNNTVMTNPLNLRPDIPFITVINDPARGPNSGNILNNNLTSAMGTITSGTTQSNNIISTAYTSHFVNYSNFDFHLKSTSAAVNAGTTTGAPAIDLDSNARTSPYDVGCYEYISGARLQPAGSTLTDAAADAHAVEVFPNPAQNVITVRHPAALAGTTLSLLSSDGQQIAVWNVQKGAVNTSCDLQKVPHGSYLIVLMSQGKAQTVKVIKL